MGQLRRTMQLLVHSSMCNDPNCQSQNCKRVKMLFKHGLECKVKYQGGCNLCRRMWALLQIHAKSCRVENCPVPRCMDLRAHPSTSNSCSVSRSSPHGAPRKLP